MDYGEQVLQNVLDRITKWTEKDYLEHCKMVEEWEKKNEVRKSKRVIK